MVRVPQERGRKPAKKYMSDLNPTNLERQGYFGTDRRKPGSVPTPASSVMYDYTTGEVIHNFDVPDLVVAPNETISIEPVITADPAPPQQQTGNQKANIADSIRAKYSRDALQQFDPQLFNVIMSAVQTQNLSLINTVDTIMTTFTDNLNAILNNWVNGNNITQTAVEQQIALKYAESRTKVMQYVNLYEQEQATSQQSQSNNTQTAEEAYEGQTDTNSGDNSPPPEQINQDPIAPSPPQTPPGPPPGVPEGHNPFTGMDTQELTMIREELNRALADEPELQNDPYFIYDYNMLTQELNNRAAAPMGRAQLAGVRQTTLRRMRQGAHVDVNQQVGDLFGAHNNVPHQHKVRQHTTESKESIDGLGSVFLKTRAAMGRLLG